MTDPTPTDTSSTAKLADDRPVVLFACVHNSGRSVAARVLTEHYAAGAVEARSAGSEPKGAVNPVVAQVLAERGLSTTAETPTLLDPGTVRAADVVITMGCGRPARSSLASGTRTGPSTTPPARTPRPCAASSTTSTPGCARCSPSSAFPPLPNSRSARP